jgi:hypothetical protein
MTGTASVVSAAAMAPIKENGPVPSVLQNGKPLQNGHPAANKKRKIICFSGMSITLLF